jgi:hypothetical protein
LLRELKDSYALAKIPSRRFCANPAYLGTILWAYDLVLAFQSKVAESSSSTPRLFLR